MTQEPTYDFPTEPVHGIRDRLAQIPLLVTEARLTEGAPNPGTEGRRRAGKPGSQAPGDLDVLELDITEHDAPATLVPLPRLVACTRLIWESFTPTDEESIGRPGDADWTTECDWLWRAWPTAQATLDAAVLDWVVDEINGVYRQLADKVRLRRERVYRCPRCGDAMRLQEGGQWLRCDSGHEESADLAGRYRRLPAMPLPMVSAALGVPEATLRTWRHRRKLQAVKVERGTPWFLPWDVLLLKHPDVAEAVARREAG